MITLKTPVDAKCGVVINEPMPSHPENLRCCDRPALIPMRLKSGFVVTWLCPIHAYIATV